MDDINRAAFFLLPLPSAILRTGEELPEDARITTESSVREFFFFFFYLIFYILFWRGVGAISNKENKQNIFTRERNCHLLTLRLRFGGILYCTGALRD